MPFAGNDKNGGNQLPLQRKNLVCQAIVKFVETKQEGKTVKAK
jgi:hypothetical protein